MSRNNPGISYRKRVAEINRIYDEHVRQGVPNREIWRRYIYPAFGISERTLYNILKSPVGVDGEQQRLLPGPRWPGLFDGDKENDGNG